MSKEVHPRFEPPLDILGCLALLYAIRPDGLPTRGVKPQSAMEFIVWKERPKTMFEDEERASLR